MDCSAIIDKILNSDQYKKIKTKKKNHENDSISDI